jgi:hypothetical protein
MCCALLFLSCLPPYRAQVGDYSDSRFAATQFRHTLVEMLDLALLYQWCFVMCGSIGEST